MPAAVGAYSTSNVVVPPPLATGVLGWLVTPKCDASAPVSTTLVPPVRLRGPLPVFSMVKVREIAASPTCLLPKSVWSAADGSVSPSAMDWLLLCTSISGSVVVKVMSAPLVVPWPFCPTTR